MTAVWTCPGCGRRISESDADMIVDHVRDCEEVDGAGRALASGTRIVSEVDHGARTVAGTLVRVTELIWDNGGRSFEVHATGLPGDDVDLTQDGCFDALPTDAQIRALLPISPPQETVGPDTADRAATAVIRRTQWGFSLFYGGALHSSADAPDALVKVAREHGAALDIDVEQLAEVSPDGYLVTPLHPKIRPADVVTEQPTEVRPVR